MPQSNSKPPFASSGTAAAAPATAALRRAADLVTGDGSLARLRAASPHDFDYLVTRSRRKSLTVRVSHARVEVRAPLFVSSQQVDAFLARTSEWIVRKLQEKARQDGELLKLEPGGEIFYQARSCRIVFEHSHQTGVLLRDRDFVIHGPGLVPPNTDDHEKPQVVSGSVDGRAAGKAAEAAGAKKAVERRAEAILRSWLMEQARALLPARSRALARYLGVEDRLREVVFRKTRSKWGHCTSAGRIQYNWLIMLAPSGVIDYMICHEVCHLLHMNHSPTYWQQVARVCPDYARYVKWLKKHEHRLWF